MSLAHADARAPAETAVRVSDLRVASLTHGVDIVADVSFEVAKGEALGVVGESGCGKTTMAMALLGYAKPGTRIARGACSWASRTCSTRRRAVSSRRADGASRSCRRTRPKALSPGMRVGRQVAEMLAVHGCGEVDDHVVARRSRRRSYHRSRGSGAATRISSRRPAAARRDRDGARVRARPDRDGRADDRLDVITQARLLEVIAELRAEHARDRLRQPRPRVVRSSPTA